MLKRLYVDGFKSLMDFLFVIKEGLNIFVGPNGSGKTNIISLFEFISYLTEDAVGEAIIRSGGVGSVFRRYADQSSMSPISISVEGEFSFYRSFSEQTHARKARYQYEFSIDRSSDTGIVYFRSQTFRFSITTAAGQFKRYKTGNPIWDLQISSSVNETLRPKISIERLDVRKIRPTFVSVETPKSITERILKLRLERMDPSAFSLIQILENYFPDIRTIKSDLYSGRAYNIIPNSVKSREDAVLAPGVQFDGSGASSTLFTLWKVAHRHENRPRPPRVFQGRATSRPLHLNERTYREVLELLRLVNSSIEDIRIIVDPYENFLRVLFSIQTEQGILEIPLQNMSDGTAKWLALTIAIICNRGIFAIEEPENFLHPYMQKEILQIIRGSMEAYERRGFAIITTHSETLLNAAHPDELVLVRMENGSTLTSRVSDPALIDEEMRRSGFGLGYLYITGVLNNA